MFTYCILKGVNEGWIHADYLQAGIQGWHGLLTMVNEHGEITNVCPPADISPKPEYYLENRAPLVHDQHALGPFLLAGAEYVRAGGSALERADSAAGFHAP